MNDINNNKLNQSADPLLIKGNRKDISYIEKNERENTSIKKLYYLWLSRFFTILAAISIAFLVLSSLAIFRLAPRVTVEPLLLIKKQSSENLVNSEVISQDIASRELIMKMFIRYYVKLRNTIISDKREMQLRWMPGGLLSFLSSPAVYNEFGAYMSQNWEKITNSPLSREVEIVSVSRQGGDKSSVWKVNFKTYDIENSKEGKVSSDNIITKYWTTSLITRFIPERAFSFYRLINPLGFTVTRYSQTEINTF